eukprot:g2182.t1
MVERLVHEWLHWCGQSQVICPLPNPKPHPLCLFHTPEQAILAILVRKRVLQKEFPSGWPFYSYAPDSRVWPHMFDTEGFFLAAFQKEQAHAAEMVRPPSPRASVRSLICRNLHWKDEGIYSMPDCQRLPKLMQLAEEEGVLLLRRDGDEFYLTDEAILLGGREMGPQDDAAWWLNLSSGLEGNLGGFNAQIDARAELGDVRGAEEVMSHILKRGLRPDVVTYTTLIKAYGRESSMSSAQKAVKILEDAREDGIWLDSAAFSTALYALARAGSLQQCERLLRSMGSSRVSPDSACFNSVIHACAAAGEPERAKYWLDQAEASSSHSPTDIARA